MTSVPLYWINARCMAEMFPDPDDALHDPDGLLAAGGDLGVGRLLDAYRRGIFPWYTEGQPILWWAPDPRAVLFPDALHVSRSLRKTLASGELNASIDRSFAAVVAGCAKPRRNADGTWITDEMAKAYTALHAAGHAHSVETWYQGQLVGGLYGVAIGRVFFGESMFARRTDASKVALVHLVGNLRRWGYALIDCQVHNAHLTSLGACPLPRTEFNALLARFCAEQPHADAWQVAHD